MVLVSDGITDADPDRMPWGRVQCRATALTVSGFHGNTCVLDLGHKGSHKTWSGTWFEKALGRRADLHDEIVRLHRCQLHKRYRARRQPRLTCATCWRLWILTHPDIEFETRWIR